MEIGLVDVDGHNFPNLCLMKLSSWHKAQGDNVEWAIAMKHYDVVYRAKVFDFTADDLTAWDADKVISGGTGYGLDNKLPWEVEKAFPDYALYGVKEAYGFLTRGCPRGCKFCIVAPKEGGRSQKVADLKDFWGGQKVIKLLDPNILACREWRELFWQLEDSKAWIDFTQGLDIRLMTAERAAAIARLKVKQIHFAWDNYPDERTYEALKRFRSAFPWSHRKLGVYVLTNFNTTLEQDLARIYALRELDYWPYVMVYDRERAPKVLRHMQRWVNNRFIFERCKRFEDYQA